MPGVRDEYVIARQVLLDALEALQDHLHAIILVGAQAIYLHAGAADVAVAEFTTDADLAIDPSMLGMEPDLEMAMQDAGFMRQTDQPGIWRSQPENVEVDLMVPAAVAGAGRRAAELRGHGKMAARKARGLEASLVDREEMTISALDKADSRSVRVAVAGPAALLVAKLHKISERRNSPTRLDAKDAYDVYRLLRAISTADLAQRLSVLLNDPVSEPVTRQALSLLLALFGAPDALGSHLAARYEDAIGDPDFVAAACTALAQDLSTTVQQH